MVEYALLISLVALTCFVAVETLGTAVASKFVVTGLP
jgi:Flp pilus assembly pilin Flp